MERGSWTSRRMPNVVSVCNIDFVMHKKPPCFFEFKVLWNCTDQWLGNKTGIHRQRAPYFEDFGDWGGLLRGVMETRCRK